MNNDTTVSNTSSSAANDRAHGIDTQLKHKPPARKKTWGEHLFNWSTYGGVALLGNEAASLAITESTKEGRPLYSTYKRFEGAFSKLSRHTNAKGEPRFGEYLSGNPVLREVEEKGIKTLKPLTPRIPYLLVATIGGMFMVPFVKWLEDNKGNLVRKADRHHYGALADSDTKLIEAHKEMDEAPKQSWGSLWKGRFTTVFAAAAADFTFGWDKALTTKIFGKEASLNGLARWVSKTSVKLFKPQNEEAFAKIVDNGTWLLTLSSTLTVLFYASSKLFAKRHEEKVERKQEQRAMHANGIYADGSEEALEAAPSETLTDKPIEKPTSQVKSVRREETIASAPQLSHGA